MKKLFVSLLFIPLAASAWQVSFDKRYTADSGQNPTNSWQAKITPEGREGQGLLLEKSGRLTYASTDTSGEAVISPVKGIVQFDFYPFETDKNNYAGFDSGNIIISGSGKQPRLRVTVKFNDAKDVTLTAPSGAIKDRTWVRIAFEYDLTRPTGQLVLMINGEVVDKQTVASTRLASPAEHFHWGMFAWGGGSWNGIYDNLTIGSK